MGDALPDARVVVFGGSSGIGFAAAQRFIARGSSVIIAGRSEAKLAGAVARLGKGVGYAVCDARDQAAVRTFFEGRHPIDHLVLSLSGGAGAGPFATLDLDALRGGFDAKFWAVANVLQASLPNLAPAASITLVSAISARAARAGTAGLAAINGAIDAMVGPLASELAPRRINVVSPGIVATPWWDRFPEHERDAIFAKEARTLPVRRVGKADDVAAVIVMLAENGFMTGTVIECAGGAHLATGVAVP
jgi:NAD(P)-dependent dehydrogenase (short-subunit alcohol dehydrogenase family)